jgi:DNA-binding PadR family transcriptional regulator
MVAKKPLASAVSHDMSYVMFHDTHTISGSHHPHHGRSGRGPSLHAIGRHGPGGGHGFGRRSRSFMGGDGAPFGRKLTSNDLQLVLLALLAEQPAHGYELIRTLEERSGGYYAPSSGMVYPALTYMDEIGQALSTTEGNRKLYTITETGRAYLAEHRAHADAILDALARIGGRMEDVRDAFAGMAGGDPAAADAMFAARSDLKHALKRMHDCSPEEARRITAILKRATAEILGTAKEAGQ